MEGEAAAPVSVGERLLQERLTLLDALIAAGAPILKDGVVVRP